MVPDPAGGTGGKHGMAYGTEQLIGDILDQDERHVAFPRPHAAVAGNSVLPEHGPGTAEARRGTDDH